MAIFNPEGANTLESQLPIYNQDLGFYSKLQALHIGNYADIGNDLLTLVRQSRVLRRVTLLYEYNIISASVLNFIDAIKSNDGIQKVVLRIRPTLELFELLA